MLKGGLQHRAGFRIRRLVAALLRWLRPQEISMNYRLFQLIASGKSALCFCLVTILGYFTYVYDYRTPPNFFWDENYHVSHAQKYLNGVFFMEPHPPLGKLLIAAGELLLRENRDNRQFVGTDHADTAPQGFSFGGYRFFPVILAWLAAPLLYLIMLLLVGSPLWAAFLSFPYLFDNALIVHSRGAMLDGPQLFFSIGALLLHLLLLNGKDHGPRTFGLISFLFGMVLGCAAAVKLNSLVLVLLFPLLCLRLWPDFKRSMLHCLSALPGFALVFCGAWYVHFAVAVKIEPRLPNHGYYQASAQYKQILAAGRQLLPGSFPIMLRDSMRFVGHYERGVPRLNLCNQSENGSPFFLWPVGARSISYRWESRDGKTKHLFLQVNPVAWLLSLIGVLAGGGVLFGVLFLPLREKPHHTFAVLTFLLLYASYMAAIGLLSRVMYLYHYFIPLIFGFLLFACVLHEVKKIGRLSLGDSGKTLVLAGSSLLLVAAYFFFSPLTYYRALSDRELKARAWLNVWDLRCPSCKLTNGFAVPTCDPKIKPFSDLFLSGIKAASAFQEWGEPKAGRTVEDQPLIVKDVRFKDGFGVHAKSSLKFRIKRGYTQFRAFVGVPDAVLAKSSGGGSVVFEVLGDGKVIWRSAVRRGADAAEEVAVDVKNVDELELSVSDAGDGIDSDHACWLEPRLIP